MAAKKPSGLGRGLGELLEDNAPVVKERSSTVSVRKDGATIRITPEGSAKRETKALFESKPKNLSVKANYRK